MISLFASENEPPSNESLVNPIPATISGKRIGKDKTGNNAPFTFARAIIAEISVVPEASPRLPRMSI